MSLFCSEVDQLGNQLGEKEDPHHVLLLHREDHAWEVAGRPLRRPRPARTARPPVSSPVAPILGAHFRRQIRSDAGGLLIPRSGLPALVPAATGHHSRTFGDVRWDCGQLPPLGWAGRDPQGFCWGNSPSAKSSSTLLGVRAAGRRDSKHSTAQTAPDAARPSVRGVRRWGAIRTWSAPIRALTF